MKTYKYIVLALSAVTLAGCNFFDSESPSAMDAATVYSNENSTEQVIASVYEQFGQDKSYRNRLACGYQGMNTDVERGSKNSGAADWNIYAMTPTSSDLSTANGKDPWGYLNTAIERCNNIIEGIETYGDTTSAKMKYMLGEAYFLRSFCYLEMVKLWGDVPPRFVSISKDPEGLNMKKADRTEVLAQLRIDFKKAAELMPWSKDCPGTAANSTCRPSKAAALAMLARTDLMYAGKGVRPATWQNGPEFLVSDASLRVELNTEVMWACAQIIDNGSEAAKLQTNYEDIFKKICADVTNYYDSEVIWEIPFADGSRGQVLQYNCTKIDKALGGLKNNEGGSSNSALTIVPTLYYDFEATDVRRDVTMARYIWVYDDGSEFNSDREKVRNAFPGVDVDNHEKFLYQKRCMIGSWYGNKYRAEWMIRTRTGNDDGINFPIIRFADVLLMAAEASIGGIGGDVPTNMYGLNGASLFSQVRSRAQASSKELTMANLQEERKLEFTGEYIRKFDLMRWGILKETLLAAHERLAQMNKHEGEFAQLQDTIYYHYKYVGDEYSFAEGIKGFVLDSVYGLNKGELGTPEPLTGGVKGSLYSSESDGRVLAPDNYMLFDREYPDRLNGRQYWPIFAVNVGQSNGALWNDYDYTSIEEPAAE